MRNGVDFVPETGVDFLSPFFRVPKNPRQIHATQNPQIHAIFGYFFQEWFLWVLDPVCVAVFGCQYFYADQPRVVS